MYSSRVWLQQELEQRSFDESLLLGLQQTFEVIKQQTFEVIKRRIGRQLLCGGWDVTSFFFWGGGCLGKSKH